MRGVLFLDDANASLSPLAEGIAQELCWRRRLDLEIWSAGNWPSHVRPEVKRVLEEAGYTSAGLRSKAVLEVDLDEVDLVIVLSMSADDKALPSRFERLRWLHADPSSAPPHERMEAYRAALEDLQSRIGRLLDERVTPSPRA